MPALTTSTPAALAVARDGTLYYADAATVRRIRFGRDRTPLAPETLNAGLDPPGGLAVAVMPAG